jgi:hypothetical protein
MRRTLQREFLARLSETIMIGAVQRPIQRGGVGVIFGKLPFASPSSMKAVRKQKADVAYDAESPLYRLDLDWDWRRCLVRRTERCKMSVR